MAVKFKLAGRLIYVLAVVLCAACGLGPGPAPHSNPPPPAVTALPTGSPAATTLAAPATPQTGQHPVTTTVEIHIGTRLTQSQTIRYLLYLPADYNRDPQKKWPLILYLHGSGECGHDLELLKRHPLPALLDQKPDYPFIVVSPQLATFNDTGISAASPDLAALSWAWSNQTDALMALLEQLQAAYAVDGSRIYLTGISLGGFGAWQIALRYPHAFAAIVPIAGGYILGSDRLPEDLCALKDLPVWAFHGALDASVPPEQDEILVKALQACGSQARLTLYPDVGHNAWDRAYADPDLYQWLLAQTRP
jgi:predicted peptidase